MKIWNLLSDGANSVLENFDKKISIGEAAIDALLGFVVVFCGIAFLVGIVWLVGYIMKKTTGKTSGTTDSKKSDKSVEKQEDKKNDPANSALSNSAVVAAAGAEELSDETVAVITAAIMAYYAQTKQKCEFTVKRIRRI